MKEHDPANCEECIEKQDEKEFVWCDMCEVHHDFSGFTHADWSAICSCGCRCKNPELDRYY